MQFYIDSSDIDEIREIHSSGLLAGITTNPSLLKKALAKHKLKNIDTYINHILELVGPNVKVSLQVPGKKPDAETLIEEGMKLYKYFNPINENVVIKIPVNPSLKESNDHYGQGLMAIRELSSQKIPVNTTLVMKPEQAVLAALAGASYVSPFLGRLDDYIREVGGKGFKKEDYFPVAGIKYDGISASLVGKIINDNGVVSGVNLVERIKGEFAKRNLDTKILAASVRNARQVEELWKIGPDIASLPYEVFKEAVYLMKGMLFHEKTLEGMRKFVDDVPDSYSELLNIIK